MMNEVADREEIIKRTCRIRREIRAVVDPYNIFDNLFQKYYRITKQMTRVLVHQLTPYLSPDDNALAVPNTIKVLAALNFYASGSYQGQVASNWMNCLGRSTVGRFIREVTDALNTPELQRRWIQFPQTKEARQRLQARHQEQFGIPGVLGFVDGTEVTITTPPKHVNPQSFWTRKNQYALNCQIICDSDLVILNINACNAGSSNDKFVYKFSAARQVVKEAFEEDQSSWLLGDSGYPIEPWLLVPIKHAEEGSPEEYYTKKHCTARNCVERCIGVLKGRFRCLLRQRALHYAPMAAGKIVKACCLLHNMCRKAGLQDDDFEVEDGEEDPVAWVLQQHEAEMEAMEEDDELDPQLVVHGNNVLEVGQLVRQRIVTFLHMERCEQLCRIAQEE